MHRGRAASLPPSGAHERPTALVGLMVTHVDEKGARSACYDFSLLPLSPEFQLEFATLFAARATPTGPWRNLPTSKQAFWAIGYFARWLARQERVPINIADIDVATWLRWRMEQMGTVASRRALRLSRMLLLESGRLSPLARRELAKRLPRDKPQESSYSDEELRLVTVAARRVWRIARDRIRHNMRHLARYRSGEFEPGTQDYLIGKILEHVAANGDVPRTMQKDRPPERWVTRALGGGHRDQTWKRLYLDRAEVTAALVLLTCKEGWNETSIQELQVPERIDGGTSRATYRVELEKRRRRPPHRYEVRTLTDTSSDSTARLIRHIVEVTQPARDALAAHGRPTERLLISRRTQGIGVEVEALFEHGLSSHSRNSYNRVSGQPVNLRRVRKAVNNRHRREPNQNSRETHESVYLLRDPHTIRESESLIARGIERALSHAVQALEATIRSEDSVMGEDTPTATCVEPKKSPYSPWGVACGASFLLCLACCNAVVMPRHLGRLAYLHESLASRRDSIPPEAWASDWAAHYARLHSLRTEHYSEGQWQQALATVTEYDRNLVDHLLKGDLDS